MMANRIDRVLTTDPGMGIVRHVDAGYEEAKEFAGKAGVPVPMKGNLKINFRGWPILKLRLSP